ncbi:MAG: polysaccharide biosynthesis protein [Bacteroidia bacterium]|nr:polysaccharide biosynthesis protein [Bacteroidia bacterium]
MTIIKKLAGQTAIYGLSSILGRLLNYLLVPLYTRVFLPGEYGVVTEMYAYASFFMIIFSYGMETAYFRFASQQHDRKKVFSTSMLSLLCTSAALVLLIYFFSGNLAEMMTRATSQNSSDYQRYILWFVIFLAADAIANIPFAQLRIENKAFRFVFIKMTWIVVNIGLNLFFLVLCPKLNPDSWLASFYNPSLGVEYVFISNLISSAIVLLLLLPEFRKMTFSFDKTLWREMMIYALPLLVAGFAGMINETIDRIFLKYIYPGSSEALVQVGIYGACYKVSILMTLFIQTFRYAAEPFFFSHAEKADAKKTYAQVMNYFVIACAAIFLSVLLYMDFVKYLIGEEFRSGLKVVPILLMANLCLGVFYNLAIWYKLTSKTKWGAYLALIGAGITVLLNFILIPRMGYMGAAWATLICYASMMAVSYLVGQKFYKVDYDLRKFFIYIISILLIYFFSERIRHTFVLNISGSTLISTILLILFGVIIYLTEKNKSSNLAQ